ncbi:MAG: hypothetical protein ACTHL8_06580 [Burkholderiaceae bacterium]
MKRPASYWAWLLADLSLDRAARITPLLGLDERGRLAVRRAVDQTGPALSFAAENTSAVVDGIMRRVVDLLGPDATRTGAWFADFPFVHDGDYPAYRYWDTRFLHLLAPHGPDRVEGVDLEIWTALKRAWAGFQPRTMDPTAKPLKAAADARLRYFEVSAAIDAERAAPISEHDLELYLRFEWNDAGSPGLASLDIGAGLDATREFWGHVSALVSAEPIEAAAHAYDLEMWKANHDPLQFVDDAKRYGVTPEQMLADMHPMPKAPPPLAELLDAAA